MNDVCLPQAMCVFIISSFVTWQFVWGGPLQRLARGMECQRTTTSNSNSEHCLLIYYHLIEICHAPLYRMNTKVLNCATLIINSRGLSKRWRGLWVFVRVVQRDCNHVQGRQRDQRQPLRLPPAYVFFCLLFIASSDSTLFGPARFVRFPLARD